MRRFAEHAGAESFRAAALDFLLEREPENHLLLSILDSVLRDPNRYERPYFAAGSGPGGRITGAAVMTPPHDLVVAARGRCFSEDLAAALARGAVRVPGVLGPARAADALFRAVCRATGLDGWHLMSQRALALTRVPAVPSAPGRLAAAEMSDVSMAERFFAEFHREIRHGATDERGRQARVSIAERRLFFWLDECGRRVSMAGIAHGRTPNGQRIGPVYTPPPFRNRGYARSLVAALCRRVLEAGTTACFLFADAANPVSNRVYRGVGFRPVCEYRQYRFGLAPASQGRYAPVSSGDR